MPSHPKTCRAVSDSGGSVAHEFGLRQTRTYEALRSEVCLRLWPTLEMFQEIAIQHLQ
jgi:hypothetical protein